jgi:transposase InsO family protein
VGDITYIATREGWLYLATVIDLYSRRVVGWSVADNMRTSLVNDALSMPLNQRKPANDFLWHSDRSSQYASESRRALLTANGITQSMSPKGL